jgi:4a-hydroxytetrahydrobiopterin dehydratase
MEPISHEQVQRFLNEHPEWEYKDDSLSTSYTFTDFKTAFRFMSLIALEAEELQHHPEWTNIYNRLSFTLKTHDAGDKVTEKDIRLARVISERFSKFRN